MANAHFLFCSAVSDAVCCLYFLTQTLSPHLAPPRVTLFDAVDHVEAASETAALTSLGILAQESLLTVSVALAMAPKLVSSLKGASSQNLNAAIACCHRTQPS